LIVPAAAGGSAGARSSLQAPPDDDPPPWYERIRFGGDLRSRYEGFHEGGVDARHRVRLRLRLRIDAEINEETRLHVQVASGDPGTPVSTNQTFTSFFTPKPFSLDRAYVAYSPGVAPGLTLGLGKFGLPQASTQMLFDEDLNFEGGWERLAWNAGDGIEVSLVGLQTAVNEVASGADAYLLAATGQVRFDAGPHALEVSAANYSYGNADQIAVASLGGPLESILTNDLRWSDNRVVGYASRFNVVDVIAEATFAAAGPGRPIRLVADFAHNTRAASRRDSGIWLEAHYGDPTRARTWRSSYTFGWIEQDVAPSAFVFSDMPGTNLRLHMIDGTYVVKEGLLVGATLHLTRPIVPAAGESLAGWLSRLHVGTTVRF
jgi:hypothetical protein